MNESIDDRLKRINAEFSKFLKETSEEPEDNLLRLIHFGLSEREAKAWLNQEPNYNRRLFTANFPKHKTDEDFTEPN
jgi:hypothetical protein